MANHEVVYSNFKILLPDTCRLKGDLSEADWELMSQGLHVPDFSDDHYGTLTVKTKPFGKDIGNSPFLLFVYT